MADLDRIIHERARLLILTQLASDEKNGASFSDLQEKLELTAGNLSFQLKKLKETEYVEIHKIFKDNKPYTTVEITKKGLKALNAYIEEVEGIFRTLKK